MYGQYKYNHKTWKKYRKIDRRGPDTKFDKNKVDPHWGETKEYQSYVTKSGKEYLTRLPFHPEWRNGKIKNFTPEQIAEYEKKRIDKPKT